MHVWISDAVILLCRLTAVEHERVWVRKALVADLVAPNPELPKDKIDSVTMPTPTATVLRLTFHPRHYRRDDPRVQQFVVAKPGIVETRV